ncbi:amino acid permease [Suhomyces tanzawaensis NRRL Y-17324]|uniref:Amino acid permease n=1 Tax=Suhomyces tanzawaensis NRRL Y-17324 TaxID=984487 RepID=A0A1E4SDL1_9ASCO|nr:amino acid permease [Suhomyces tanzawaensis NRRL Y-17324]ODV77556.1 amino acid permease [Suhomyces tanzawaensis NRRL Y-17324]
MYDEKAAELKGPSGNSVDTEAYSYRQESSPGQTNSRHSGSSYADSAYTYETIEEGNAFSRFIDSFKPINLEDEGFDTTGMTMAEKSIIASARHPLARRLKSRHLQMIAIGGSIGTGLFVGSGYGLALGGPGAVLIGYTLIGYSMLCVVNALGELSVQFPVSGSFNAFFTRFVDPSLGFTFGILYACSWLISFPSELIACAMTVQYWNQSVDPAVWVAIFYVVIVSINFFGVKGYGEAEFVLSGIKVIAVIGFIILGICIICGVGDQGYIGGRYWHNPGAFNHGFKGVCNMFISAAFSFGGIELVALAAAETKNPRKSLPKATKQVFWRVTIFYFLTAIVIGCLVPYTNEDLLTGDGIAASPFVIAIQLNGIKVVPHIMNAVVLIAVVSVGNSSVYGCSRTLASLAVQGLIPGIFGYIDRAGRPMVAIMFTNMIGLLGFLVKASAEGEVFTWFFSVCSLSSFFTWCAICFTHLRWRWALSAQGRSLDEVIFVSPLGTFGDYTGIAILLFVVGGEIWVSLFPIGAASADNMQFWKNCLSLPLMVVMIVAHKTIFGSWRQIMVKLTDIDLDTGRREIDVETLKQEIADEKQALADSPFWYRFYRFWC